MGSILTLAAVPYFPIDGATKSMYERLRRLQRDFGWRCAVCCTGRVEQAAELLTIAQQYDRGAKNTGGIITFKILEVPIEIGPGPGLDLYGGVSRENFWTVFSAAVQRHAPAVVFGNTRDSEVLSFLVTKMPDRHLVFITEDEFPRPGAAAVIDEMYRSIRRAAVASAFLQHRFKESWGLEPQLFTNAIDVEECKIDRKAPGNSITLFHPHPQKGVGIFLTLANLLPDRKFLLAGGSGKNYRELIPVLDKIPNLTHLKFQLDIRPILQATRLVLVPSLWEEAFSRVVIESFAAGLPVIASDTGGLRESGGDAALYISVNKIISGSPPPPQNIKPWIDAITLLDSPETYRRIQAMGDRRIDRFKQELDAAMKNLNHLLATAFSPA